MGTNACWPEAFGFSVCGGAPVVIREVEEGGSAQQAGLQPGDVITELDGDSVEQWSLEQVVSRARESAKVPPSMVVISRVRQFCLHRDQQGGYGLTVRGNGPVFVRSVDFPGPARNAGLRSGDLILEVAGQNMQCGSKLEVLELLRGSGEELTMMVVTGGLDWLSSPSLPFTSHLTHNRKIKNSTKYQKASDFHNKVNYYLMGDRVKKTHLLTLLRLYARDRDVDSLATSLDVLLEGPIERRLIPAVRDYLQPRHHSRFDTVLLAPFPATPTKRRSSEGMPRPLAATRDVPWTSSLPSLTTCAGKQRVVQVSRGCGGFGFSLSGNAPVFIRSVDTGGPAALAGLQPGDTLLAINGLNIRNATHSHVVRLLRGSGTTPSLLVSSPSSHSRHGSLRRNRVGVASYRGGVASPITEEMSIFQQKMEGVLQPRERSLMMKEITSFTRQKDISKLVEGLRVLLSDPTKMVLFHYVCQLLPEDAQAEFDRLAAAAYGNEAGGQSTLTRTGSDASLREEEDILEDTAIGSVGESGGFEGGLENRGILGPLQEENEGEMWGDQEWEGQSHQWREGKGRSVEDTPGIQRGAGGIGRPSKREESGGERREEGGEGRKGRTISTPLKRRSTEPTPLSTPEATPLSTPVIHVANITSSSTPGTIPPPPPTPVVGPGGVPIPPPPPPSSLSSQPQMKRVNWQKMTSTDGTVWGEMSGLDEAIELAELDTKFALRRTKEAAGSLKRTQPSVLDSKKAYNISILLGHLKLPTQVIKQAVLSCDDGVLEEQHLRQMEAFAPDKKECLGFAHYYDDPSVLSLPDQFSCEMSTIPCYRERLHAMVFRLHYHEKVEEIRPDLEAICQASIQLQKSKCFKKILELVLAIGNHMNMGSVRIGQAQGFQISFLTQLRGLRTTDGSSTLLHFLAGLTERKFPHVLGFQDELSCCPRAARVSGQTLEVEMHELSQGLRDIRKNIPEISSRDELPGDRFHDVMISFLAESEGKMTELVELYSNMKQDFKQVVLFFGEDPTKMRIDDFFSIFASFMTDFERAVSENRQERQGELKHQRRLEEGGTSRRCGQSNKPRPPNEDQYQQFKKELEKMRLRPIPQRRQSGTELRPWQTDFTHLLRPVRNRATVTTPTSPRPSIHDDETRF